METFTSTITVPLEKYDAMVKELETLREEVKEKTIIKYHPHWAERIAAYICGASLIWFVLSFILKH